MRVATLLLPLALLASTGAASANPTISATVRARLVAGLRSPDRGAGGEPAAAASGTPSAARLVADQQPDGSWSDVPYDDRGRSEWLPIAHLHRLLALARAADGGGPGAPAAQAALGRGLAFWVRLDPQSDNWWFNTIGSQQALAPVLVLARADLKANAPELWEAACRQMARSHTDGMTGTNLVWEAGNLFVLAALQDDDDALARELGLIEAEIRITTGEGVQPDFSFHQHGPQLNAGNYGLSFVPAAARYALLVAGTPLAFPAAKVEVLTRFERDFQERVVWGSHLDLSSCGRQLDQPHAQTTKARAIARAGLLLGRLVPSDAPHWQEFFQRAEGRRPPEEGAPTGARYYWRSDYLVHRPGAWYFSVKMFSPRVLRTETKVNGENRRGYHLSDGMTQLLVRGDEYDEIQPVWDWRRLPGITYKDTAAPFPYGNLAATERNPRAFVGGVQAGDLAVAAMEIFKDGVAASKAWFCFPSAVICLGADIHNTGAEPVYTVIEQSLLRGPPENLSDRAIVANGTGYVLLGPPQHWRYTAGPQTGAWSLLRDTGASSEPVTRDVFKLWIDHGTRPRAAGYAYALLPAAPPARVRSFAAHPPYRILANTAEAQIVAAPYEGVVAAIFHRPGSAPAVGGLPAFRVDAPCIVLARRAGPADRRVRFFLADPTQQATSIHLSVAARPDTAIALPRGGLAGSTVTTEPAGI